MNKAFTMLELIFVIIIVGIVSAMSYSSFQRDELAEAAHQVLEHIRYTQHLALTEKKFTPRDTDYTAISSGTNHGNRNVSWWQIRFFQSGAQVYYSIYSDRDREGNVDTASHQEPAIDPLTKSNMMYDIATTSSTRKNDDFLLSTKYNISSIIAGGGCSPASGNPTKVELHFDELGRPYRGAEIPTSWLYRYKITLDCTITMTHAGDGRAATITVKPESGYAFISAIN